MNSTTISCAICGDPIVVQLNDEDDAIFDYDEIHTNEVDEVICATCCGCGQKECPKWAMDPEEFRRKYIGDGRRI